MVNELSEILLSLTRARTQLVRLQNRTSHHYFRTLDGKLESIQMEIHKIYEGTHPEMKDISLWGH